MNDPQSHLDQIQCQASRHETPCGQGRMVWHLWDRSGGTAPVVVLFHGTYGFQEVGQQRMGQDGPQVSLLAKDLPSYTYVRETWLDHGGLPDVPWLAESPRLMSSIDRSTPAPSSSGEPR